MFFFFEIHDLPLLGSSPAFYKKLWFFIIQEMESLTKIKNYKNTDLQSREFFEVWNAFLLIWQVHFSIMISFGWDPTILKSLSTCLCVVGTFWIRSETS